jgi:hypothetical protein
MANKADLYAQTVAGRCQRLIIVDAFAKTYRMAKQKFRSTRPGVFSGVKEYI